MRLSAQKSLAFGGCGAILAFCTGCTAPDKIKVPDPNPETQSVFDSAMANRAQIQAQIEPLMVLPAGDLPGSGILSYSGIALVATSVAGESLELSAQATIDAQLASNTLSGYLGGWVDENSASFSGVLHLSDAHIIRTADPNSSYAIMGDLAGNLNSASGTISVDAQVFGDFFGEDARAISGGITGSATVGGDEVYWIGNLVALK